MAQVCAQTSCRDFTTACRPMMPLGGCDGRRLRIGFETDDIKAVCRVDAATFTCSVPHADSAERTSSAASVGYLRKLTKVPAFDTLHSHDGGGSQHYLLMIRAHSAMRPIFFTIPSVRMDGITDLAVAQREHLIRVHTVSRVTVARTVCQFQPAASRIAVSWTIYVRKAHEW